MGLARRTSLAAASALSLAYATAAQAQAAPAAATSPSVTTDTSTPSTANAAVETSGPENDIIVTAEKRSSTVQTTPLAIVAVSTEQLRAQHVTETSDLATVVPNLQIVPIAQTVQINIRGVGSNFFDPRAQASVSQSIDGFYYSRPPQAGATFYDLSRVEVLKGPQGTLYGTNAAAGAVNLVTNHPVDHFEASAEIGIGNYSEREYGGMINVPIGETFAVRVAGKGYHHDGFIADYYDDAADDAFRISAQWKPSSRLTVFAAYNFSNFDGHGSTPTSFPCDKKPYSNTISDVCAPPGVAGGTYALTGKTKTRLQTIQLNVDYDVDFATLTSVTGYMTQYIKSFEVPNGTFFVTDLDQRSHDFSQELRLAGRADGHQRGELGWVVGGFFSTGNGSQLFKGLGTSVLSDLPETTYAGFAQATYGVTDTIRATAGVRYTHDKKGTEDNIGSKITFREGRVNYRAAVEADVAPRSLLFASVSTGYEAGGANAGTVGLPVPPGVIPPTFKPETITSFEIGSKNTFFDGKLRLNLDLYYYTIKDFQSYDPGFINTFVGGPNLQIQNIADVKTYGAELDGVFSPTPNDRFSFSGSLARGHYGAITINTFAFSPMGIPGPNLISVPSGYPLTNLPKWDVRLGYNHTFELGGGDEIQMGVNSHISGSYYTVPASTDRFDKQSSYTKTDLNVTYTSSKGFSVTGWVKNVENEVVNNYGENPGFHLYYPAPPRTFGGTISVKFH